MGVTNHRIASYQYEFRQEPSRGEPLSLGVLYLYDQHKSLLAVLVFRDGAGSTDLPQEMPDGHVTAQFSQAALRPFIDMLRNEKPVYLSWAPETQSLRVSTDAEPVGEEERRKLLSWLYI